ncbi:NEL-type E3 ubiquitin ligase domain-containing protein [Candidatus Regiella endosymbiont of Tuberolachnus salignus]|uniref:NEL-type E3 ubiquitin ligase domain-containing protein n=1 Tax=Candidatus Regiella endosymbiont of Tuberolachnus salignus TaxID=3077956 RepID=UPI0030D04B6B
MAEEATATCEDRVSHAYNQMKLLILIADIEAQKSYNPIALSNVIELGRGCFRLEKLEQIARNKAKSLRLVDEIEVYLSYQVKLRERLALPLDTVDMRFYDVSYVTDTDLNNAAAIVMEKEKTELLDFFSTDWSVWQSVLKKLDSENYEKALAESNSEQTSLRFQQEFAAEISAKGLPMNEPELEAKLGPPIMRKIKGEIMAKCTNAFLTSRELSLY